MSPPDTNIPKQTRRHRPALLAIVGALAAIGLILILTAAFVPDDQNEGTISDNALQDDSD